MRIVLDTNILVRANRKSVGPARELLLKIIDGDHVLILSPFLLSEVREVLAYPRIQKLWRLTESEIRRHCTDLARNSELVAPESLEPIIEHDPDDDAVLHAAKAGQAEVLCTLDRDFYGVAARAFCEQHGIKVMDDLELLEILRRSD